MPKSHRKLLAFNKIYYEMQKKYGFKAANEWLKMEWIGALYMHDSDTSTFKSYCFAYDLKDLAEKGLFFLGKNFNAKPPQHLGTFVDFVKEFINFASNRTSGAVGLPDLIPYMYYFVDRQEKAQAVLNNIMENYYDMGRDRLALSGMDDAGEMSSWYVFNAIGLYTYSPADPEYIVTVPLFPEVSFTFADGHTTRTRHEGQGGKINSIAVDNRQLKGWFINDNDLKRANTVVITTK
jgi:anaerobic ribonucleoside-triphosphate reductase